MTTYKKMTFEWGGKTYSLAERSDPPEDPSTATKYNLLLLMFQALITDLNNAKISCPQLKSLAEAVGLQVFDEDGKAVPLASAL